MESDKNENDENFISLEQVSDKSRKRKNPFREEHLKEEKEKRRQKRARIIIRNISYKATSETLREHFEKFGKIVDLNLLKRPDGKLVGCAFIQYETVNQASKAIHKSNNQSFLSRSVFVDWALGKNEYEQKKKSSQPKSQSSELKDDDDIQYEDENGKIKSESDNESIKSEKDSVASSNEIKSEENTENENEDKYFSELDSDNNETEPENKKKIKLDDVEINKSKNHSNDLEEGCTIFVKNVPFDATNDDLRKLCRKFGPLYYALVNTDRISGHSKGTAFVKFKQKESADICLRSGEEFNLMGSVLEPFEALSRTDIQNKSQNKNNKEKTDSRNLYLAKEGLIMVGSPAAEGVSASDMSKRHKLEQVKTQILKNLNRFVSRNRLSIHNLPLNYDDDNKLKSMIITFTNLKPHECKIMRENKPSAGYLSGKPKGFGFVSFQTHKDAITALRKLNNNPNVFGNANRPIVGFSIEDRSVHNIKEKRMKKSKIMNPTYKTKIENRKEQRKRKKQEKKISSENKFQIKNIKNSPKKNSKQSTTKETAALDNNFMGIEAKPGTFIRMRSHKKIAEQAKEHKKKSSEAKRKVKKQKEKLLHRKEKNEKKQTNKSNKKPKVDSDNFSNLVDKYKKLIKNASEHLIKKPKRTKWFVE